MWTGDYTLLDFLRQVPAVDRCVDWPGVVGNGYGVIQMSQPRKLRRAHRVSYELHVGPIPEGFQIDHLCRNTVCVNPRHLEAVTPRVNVLRGETITAANAVKTHCLNGHPFSGDNLILRPRGRDCRACRNARAREYMRAKRARAKAG